MIREIADFIHTDPKIPSADKKFVVADIPEISVEDSRSEIIWSVSQHTDKSELALLTMYIYRQMDKIDWLPFIKASIERNPVCFIDLSRKSVGEVYDILSEMENHSIYDDNRLSLPDEVWNFRSGDGIEKAILLADFIMKKDASSSLSIEIDNKTVVLRYNDGFYNFTSSKSLKKSIKISDGNYSIT